MVKKSTYQWVAGLLFVYLSAAILILGVDAIHLRPDENLVYDFTRNDWPYLVRYLAEQDSHPPLWFSTFWLWRQIAGDSEFAGRMLSWLYSVLTLALVYQLGRRWFGAARYGWFSVLLLGVNGYFFLYALEIRPYALILLLVATSMWWFQRWLSRESWRAALYYAVTLGFMLYVHYFLFVLMMVQGLCFLLWRPSRRLWRQAMRVTLIAVLIWLPWLPAAVFQVLHVRQAEVGGGNERGLIGAGSTTLPTSWSAVKQLAAVAMNGQEALYILILIIGAFLLWRQANYRLALVWALGVPAVSLLVNLNVAVFLPRYVVYLVVGLVLALGAGLAATPRWARWPLLVVTVGISFLSMRTQLPADRVPIRDLFREISVTARPGDALFFDQGGLTDGFIRAQVRRYLDHDLWAGRLDNFEAAQAARRVWYVNDHEWWTEAARARFGQLEATHPLQQVIGDCNRDWCYLMQLLEAPPLTEPVRFGDALEFRGMDVDAVTTQTIETRLWWTASAAIPLDYSIGLQLFDAQGMLVAQSDSAIQDFYSDQLIQTSAMEPGKIYIDARMMTLPADLPAGEYQLAVLVYQSWDNTRLLLADGQDKFLLQTISYPPDE